MYFWKDWNHTEFAGFSPVTHKLEIYSGSSRDINTLKVWNNRDNLDIKDPKEPPLEKNKEIYIKNLNNHFNILLNTCTVIVVDSEFLLNEKQQNVLKCFINSDKEEMILNDRWNKNIVLNKYKAELALKTIQKVVSELKEELNKNLEIVKNSKSNKELCTGVYFFNYYEKDCILDYVE